MDIKNIETHFRYMQLALQEAEYAFSKNEIPIGAVIVAQGRVIAKAHNLTETLKDATAHAEMLALTAAMQQMGNKYLPTATLYVTLEPCHMCAGALFWSQIGQVVYAARDPKKGACRAEYLHPKTQVIEGILADEGLALVRKFLRQKRSPY